MSHATPKHPHGHHQHAAAHHPATPLLLLQLERIVEVLHDAAIWRGLADNSDIFYRNAYMDFLSDPNVNERPENDLISRAKIEHVVTNYVEAQCEAARLFKTHFRRYAACLAKGDMAGARAYFIWVQLDKKNAIGKLMDMNRAASTNDLAVAKMATERMKNCRDTQECCEYLMVAVGLMIAAPAIIGGAATFVGSTVVVDGAAAAGGESLAVVEGEGAAAAEGGGMNSLAAKANSLATKAEKFNAKWVQGKLTPKRADWLPTLTSFAYSTAKILINNNEPDKLGAYGITFEMAVGKKTYAFGLGSLLKWSDKGVAGSKAVLKEADASLRALRTPASEAAYAAAQNRVMTANLTKGGLLAIKPIGVVVFAVKSIQATNAQAADQTRIINQGSDR